MEAKASGKQTIAKSNLNDIILGHACCRENPGNQVGPGLDVISGIPDNRCHPGCPGRRMDSDNIPQRHCKEAIGIIMAQVVLRGKRQAG